MRHHFAVPTSLRADRPGDKSRKHGSKNMKGYRVGVDAGGTFTDLILLDPQGPLYDSRRFAACRISDTASSVDMTGAKNMLMRSSVGTSSCSRPQPHASPTTIGM
jgi:hypothetical protein